MKCPVEGSMSQITGMTHLMQHMKGRGRNEVCISVWTNSQPACQPAPFNAWGSDPRGFTQGICEHCSGDLLCIVRGILEY